MMRRMEVGRAFDLISETGQLVAAVAGDQVRSFGHLMAVIVEPDPHCALTQPLSNPASSPTQRPLRLASDGAQRSLQPASGGERRLVGRYASTSVRILVSGWRWWPPKIGPW